MSRGELRTKYYDEFGIFCEKIDSVIDSTTRTNKAKVEKLIGEKIQLFNNISLITDNTHTNKNHCGKRVARYRKYFSFVSINNPYNNYDKLKIYLNSIKRKSEYVYFDSIDWNFFNDKYYYVCSNCAINEEGINYKYRAFKHGFNFNFDDKIGESTAFNDFADVIIEYPYELFIILSFPILSLLITPLAKIGLSPNITLFIKGNMGSGKTELATIFDSFFNRTEDYNKNALSNNIYAVMNKFKTFENAFANHKDCTFILDDVHKPKSTSQYKNVQTNINHITRSIYSSSKLNEKKSNCLCIMTGELLEEFKSTISRMIDKGVLCWVWIEEAYEIREDDFNKVDLSIRGEVPEGYFKQITLTFNPWSATSWLKARFFDAPDEDTFVKTTTWQCNEWLDVADRSIFLKMQKQNLRRYRIEAIANCAASVGILSYKTIIGMHPWIDDPQHELELLKSQREEEQAELERQQQQAYDYFGQPGQQKNPPQGEGGDVNEK